MRLRSPALAVLAALMLAGLAPESRAAAPAAPPPPEDAQTAEDETVVVEETAEEVVEEAPREAEPDPTATAAPQVDPEVDAEIDPDADATETPAPGEPPATPMPRIAEPPPREGPPARAGDARPPRDGEPKPPRSAEPPRSADPRPPAAPRLGSPPPFAGGPRGEPGSPLAPGGAGDRKRPGRPEASPSTRAAGDGPAPSVATGGLPTLDALTETRQRPLFVVGRRGPAAVAAPIVEETPEIEPEETPAAPAELQLVLNGVVAGPGLGLAILSDPGGTTHRMKIGDEHDGWKLIEVDRVTARFGRGDERAELKLKPPGSTAVAASPVDEEGQPAPMRRRPPKLRPPAAGSKPPPSNPDGE